MIKQKRESLERFVKEQIIGPGINGYRFVDIMDQELMDSSIRDLEPISYRNEIINIAPAAVYSSAILFPARSNSNTAQDSAPQPAEHEPAAQPGEAEDVDIQNIDQPDVEDADSIQLDQMYPRTMGFTCCLQESALQDENGIEIKVQARYYRKLRRSKSERFHDRYGIICEVEREEFLEFINRNELGDSISLADEENAKGNNIILIKHLAPDEISAIRSQLRERQKNYAEELFDEAEQIIHLDKITKAKAHLSNLKSTLYNLLRYSIIDDTLKERICELLERLETAESIFEHLQDLLDISGGGFGLWRSEDIERSIRLTGIVIPQGVIKTSILYQDDEEYGLRDIFSNSLGEDGSEIASLSLNVQLSRDTRSIDGEKIYLKLQLVNSSTIFREDPNDNRYFSTFNEKVNEKCFFGVKLSINNDLLLPYNDLEIDENKESYTEEETTKFTYRQFEDFGIGHGCSVKWSKTNGTKVETEYIPVCDTPDVETVPRNKEVDPIIEDENRLAPTFLPDSKTQQFKWLSTLSDVKDEEIIEGLFTFVRSYKEWISVKRDKYSGMGPALSKIAKQELKKCESDYARMDHNIKTFLEGDRNSKNLRIFRLMNTAMYMQLWHSINGKNGKIKTAISSGDIVGFTESYYKATDDRFIGSMEEPVAWRAFQLAFIILNLDGIFKEEDDTKWKKRNELVDLVWFPTGGGKTEAYLGIIAMTIINRRFLWGERGGGTAAIMRYTLRLLTLQQFQRATLLIMALELIRRWKVFDLGDEPIYIGLWVGEKTIPNRMEPINDNDKDNLVTEFRKLLNGEPSKIPFDQCPFCGSTLIPSTHPISNSSDLYNYNRLCLKCSENNCSFFTGRPSMMRGDQGPLPMSLCDEEIYQHPPALIFGTVDKFAQLAHKVSDRENERKKDSRRIFGRGNWEEGRPQNGYLPPDLIIQDELHLLLGPLGSSVALFESAVDRLSRRPDGTRPKVISSTATTRNTGLQISAIFDREVNIFPKPGVECDDSFFSFYKRTFNEGEQMKASYLSKRRYMGFLPTGKTQIWMQMRLIAILLTHRALFEIDQIQDNSPCKSEAYTEGLCKAMDYYHTVVSYFNSLRELGKTESQIQSYILKEVRRVFNRVIRPKGLMHSLYTYGPIQVGELTSRLTGEEVKNELIRIQDKWDHLRRLAHEEEETNADGSVITATKMGTIPPEIVVATNMISVGIDISRFNTIIMNSMPRNIAEYIQASSRVARDSYGMVLTVHHPFRARDISHYERFIDFHEKMYSYVEPISITPFTRKAVERYMSAYVATVLRHMTRFVNNSTASDIADITQEELDSIVDDLTLYFENRARRLSESNFEQSIKNLLVSRDVENIKEWIMEAVTIWIDRAKGMRTEDTELVFKLGRPRPQTKQLYVDINEYETNIHSKMWQVPMALRVIDPEAAIRINQK
jgi:hypothetical protein